MAVALVVPLTYFLSPLAALAAVVTLEACAISAGDIPSALVRIPGHARLRRLRGRPLPARATRPVPPRARRLHHVQRDRRPVRRGRARSCSRGRSPAIATGSRWRSTSGSTSSASAARWSSRAAPRSRARSRSCSGCCFSTVGLSAVHTEARFTFGRPELYQGINFIPALVGLFGLSEVLRNVRAPGAAAPRDRARGGVAVGGSSLGAVFGGTLGALPGGGRGRRCRPARSARSSASSPARAPTSRPGCPTACPKRSVRSTRRSTGAARSKAWPTPAPPTTRRWPGRGCPRSPWASPGDSITAIVLGIMMMKNLQPGPEIFEKQAVLVHSLYLVFVLANLALLPAGYLAIRASGALMRVPRHTLLPVIVLFCVLGSYAIGGSYFDVGLMLVMGLLGLRAGALAGAGRPGGAGHHPRGTAGGALHPGHDRVRGVAGGLLRAPGRRGARGGGPVRLAAAGDHGLADQSLDRRGSGQLALRPTHGTQGVRDGSKGVRPADRGGSVRPGRGARRGGTPGRAPQAQGRHPLPGRGGPGHARPLSRPGDRGPLRQVRRHRDERRQRRRSCAR